MKLLKKNISKQYKGSKYIVLQAAFGGLYANNGKYILSLLKKYQLSATVFVTAISLTPSDER